MRLWWLRTDLNRPKTTSTLLSICAQQAYRYTRFERSVHRGFASCAAPQRSNNCSVGLLSRQLKRDIMTSAPQKRKEGPGDSQSSDGEMQVFKVVKRVGEESKKGAKVSPAPETTKKATINSFFRPTTASGSSQSSVSTGSMSDAVTWHHDGLGPEESCHVGVFRDPFSKPTSSSSKSSLQRISAFDLDGTLIETKSGRPAYNFQDEYDFRIWGRDPNHRKIVIERLQDEASKGSLVVIITSQYGRQGAKLKPWRARLNHIMRALNVPAIIIVSYAKDHYRKPNAGWMDHLRYLWSSNGGKIPLDIGLDTRPQDCQGNESFFVGDAAGRLASGSRKADFADTDRKLAENLGWKFFTPEEFFLGQNAMRFSLSGYRPPPNSSDINGKSNLARLTDVRRELLESQEQTMLILVGPQASGKSKLATEIESSGADKWVRVNQDLLKTRAKCIKVAQEALQGGKSVVVDNTSPTKEVRSIWTTLAKQAGVSRIVCVHFDLTLQEASHNDDYRSKRWLYDMQHNRDDRAPQLPKLPKSMPAVAFATYFKTLSKPDAKKEDIDAVYTVGVEFDGDEIANRAWRLWYS
ncbi:unnamed protein product [Sympodiomycopsis kandeliae]